jgi:sulfur carrier protein
MIHVNGEPADFAPGTTIAELVRAMDAPDRGVAVALDGEVVPRGTWDATPVGDEAHVEIVMAVQGG